MKAVASSAKLRPLIYYLFVFLGGPPKARGESPDQKYGRVTDRLDKNRNARANAVFTGAIYYRPINRECERPPHIETLKGGCWVGKERGGGSQLQPNQTTRRNRYQTAVSYFNTCATATLVQRISPILPFSLLTPPPPLDRTVVSGHTLTYRR